MVEYWARLRNRLEDGKIIESEYYLKEIKFPLNPTAPYKEYTVSLNLNDDDQLMIQSVNKDEDVVETAESLKTCFRISLMWRERRNRRKNNYFHQTFKY